MNSSYYWPEFIAEINKELKTGQTLLDAGAGDRHWRDKLRNDVKYISMDLGVGDDAVDYSGLDIRGDLKTIPLDDGSVDVIICIQVLEHVTEPWNVLDEFYRVLKPNGFLFLTCPQGVPLHQEPFDFYRYTNHGLRYLLGRSKFNIEFIIPQYGSVHKLANDLKILSNELTANQKRIQSFLLRFIIFQLSKLLRGSDSNYLTNTTGYFTKSCKA